VKVDSGFRGGLGCLWLTLKCAVGFEECGLWCFAFHGCFGWLLGWVGGVSEVFG